MTHTPPRYITNEQVFTPGASRHPPVTGYRLLVTGTVFIFGMGKAISAYLSIPTVPHTLEWIFGVIVTTR